MKIFHLLMGLSGLLFTSSMTFAQPIQGMSFSHLDWEIYCSNTGTCRAAGYQDDSMESMPVSILLTRQAGAKQAVQAEFALSDDEQALEQSKLKNIHFYINNQDLGVITFEGDDALLMGSLNKKQVNVLIQHAKQGVKIVFKNSHYTWQVSDAGMTATLLKMDDFQKRIGTVGALVKKGTVNESKVLAQQPKLRVKHVKTSTEIYATLKPSSKNYSNLHQQLMSARPKNQDGQIACEGVYAENDIQPQNITLYALSHHKVLATTLCWRGAYNEGYGIWVLDKSLIGKADFVTEIASDIESGTVSSAQKGRGIGDCWATGEWIWNGQRFIQTLDRWSGMCKGLEAGGVWELDKIEAIVQ